MHDNKTQGDLKQYCKAISLLKHFIIYSSKCSLLGGVCSKTRKREVRPWIMQLMHVGKVEFGV